MSWSPALPEESARWPFRSCRGLATRWWHRPAGSNEEAYLKNLGAAAVIDRSEFATPVKPLAKMRWAAAVDSVGSLTLANVLSQVKYGGTVAACGLAQGIRSSRHRDAVHSSGGKLIGCDSVNCPKPARMKRMAASRRDLDARQLEAMATPREA